MVLSDEQLSVGFRPSRKRPQSAAGRSDQGNCPACILRGEYDRIATNEDLWDFFRQLPNGKSSVRHNRRSRAAFWHAMQSFLTMPAPPTA
jgi:hypothetical protein